MIKLLALFVCAFAAQAAGTLSLHPESKHCLLFGGRPVVLVTAGEHYGAVLNRDFHYVPYLDAIAKDRLNLTRIFTYFRELEGSIKSIGAANTLAPKLGREVMPWARTGPGKALDGGLKYDLTKWNPEYFARLKDFLDHAARRGIAVEITFYTQLYEQEQWELLPHYKDNNINSVGTTLTTHRQLLEESEPATFEFQKAFIRKMVRELNAFDNVYYEISNETTTRRPERELAAPQAAWHLKLAAVVRETERTLPKKHLVAINAHQKTLAYKENGRDYIETGDDNYFTSPLVDIINYHYMSRKTPGRGLAAYDVGPPKVGNIPAFFRARRHVTKPLGYDENWSGVVQGAPVAYVRNRIEAWETIVSGGAIFDHLEWAFTPEDPTGSGKGPIGDGRRLDSRPFRAQLGVLADYWREAGPARMFPDNELVAAAPRHTLACASSRKDGSRRLIYIADARPDEEGFGTPLKGTVKLRVGAGKYRVRLLHSGSTKWVDAGEAAGDTLELPVFREDCVVDLSGHNVHVVPPGRARP